MTRLLPALLLFACQAEEPIDLTDAPTSGSRHRMPHVEFDIWTDYLSLEVGLSDECTFLEPLVENHSVRNPPVQVFWVMYQNEEDAVDGAIVEDTFWLGDRTANTDYPERDGLTAFGFKFPPPVQQSFLNIEEVSVSDDRRQVDGVLGSPIDARLRMVASDDAGECTITHTYCAMPCDAPDAALDHILIDLGGLLNTVQDVTFVEP
ncbi:MAG: hypothetical protein EP330_26400 [Deltaproteobacteria bacterium]|nr:MAG: hypothetical protein EP330_26400 [Deltaproteobacteria bacterium]